MTHGRKHPVQASFIKRWGPALLMMLTIFAFSAMPGDDLPSFGLVDLLVKKGGHFAGYFLLGLANLRAFSGKRRYPALCAFGLALAFALTDELHQVFTPGRHPALSDVGIDCAGAALGLFVAAKFSRLRAWVLWRVNS